MEYTSGIGVMSGTSLDGIDLAWCKFAENEQGLWHYEVVRAATYPYAPELREQLAHAMELSALDYCKLNITLGKTIAERINTFVGDDAKPDFIASHGHTIFHQPDIGLTTQIGSGAVIAAETGITTVCDFRTLDVAYHGQGAPLVPIGDQLLFGQYDACLNLGGFSNISFQSGQNRVAFDVSPCNMGLNLLANKLGLPYDKDGNAARSGKVIPKMLSELNHLEYYAMPYPKSLGKEWFDKNILPIFDTYIICNTPEDCLRTFAEHIAEQIANAIPADKQNLLITGGGALNSFLIERIQKKWPKEVIVADDLTINYKEAIVFAFLGYLRLYGKDNCLSSVTGAETDNCGGCIWNVKKS